LIDIIGSVAIGDRESLINDGNFVLLGITTLASSTHASHLSLPKLPSKETGDLSRKAKDAAKIIFAVGSPDDLRSSIWRLWVHGNDVYFGARIMTGLFKVSLHKDGNWHIAFTRPPNPQGKNSDRFALRWQRPAKHLPGATACVAVLVSPIAPKRPFKQGKVIDDPAIKWVSFTPGKGLTIVIWFIKADTEVTQATFADGHTLIGCLKKANAETVCAVANEHDLTDAQRAKIAEVEHNLRITMPPGQWAEDVMLSNSRFLLVVSDPQPGATNPPTIVDVPIGGENVGPPPHYWGWAWNSDRLKR
jgi:hypothetical protein